MTSQGQTRGLKALKNLMIGMKTAHSIIAGRFLFFKNHQEL